MKVRKPRSSQMVLLTGYSSPNSAFYKKRQQQILRMKLKHLNRNMMPRQLQRQHVRDMLAKVNL